MMPHPVKIVADALPDKPGIYFFKNAAGEVLYIGKARSLAARVKSYFQPSDDPKVRNILAETTRLDYLLTGSEREAVFLENNFIQQAQPKFNLRLKDDKSFPYLRLTVPDNSPGIFLTRKVAVDGARYFGPFSPAREARKTIQLVTRHFRLRTCEDAVFRVRKRSCLEFELGFCAAPCVGRVTPEAYRSLVRDAVLFLEGRTGELAESLRERMVAAAAAERFEEAAHARDLLRTIEQIRSRPNAISVRLENLDIFGWARAGSLEAIPVFHMRGGKVRESREFTLEGDPSRTVGETLGEFLAGFYADHPLPDKIIVPAAPPEAAALREAWSARAGHRVSLFVPRSGDNRKLLDWAVKNAEVLLRKAGAEQIALEELRMSLGLAAVPVRIDGFDVSHTQGVETVASLVTFLGGRPWKEGYRTFKVRTVSGPDDTAAMSEVVERRYVRLLREQRPLPDFILVDGGLPQLHAAQTALAKLGLSRLPIGALAKREEIIFTPDRPAGIRLDQTSSALKLAQHIRDEAHRFAVSFHRRRRTKRSFA
jgi:excinuclease ABC subunit C